LGNGVDSFKERSELSPRRGFASLGSTTLLVINRIQFKNYLSPLRGSPHPPFHYPRLAKPRLGLKSAAATQVLSAATEA